MKDRSTVTANNSKGTETSADAKADAADDADALTPPTVAQDPAHQGGIIVKPAADADKVTVKYSDEDGNEHTVTVSKDPASGQWSGTGLPKGVSVDPATGTVTLAPEAVKDRSTVTANNSKGSETSADATAQAADDADAPNPVAANDTVNDVPLGQAAEVDVLANDTDPQGRDTLDKSSVKLVDTNGQGVTTLNVAGEGTWTVDTTSGKITFTPATGFVSNPTPVKYTVADVDGNVSNPATVTVNYAASPNEIPAQPILEKGTGAEQGGVTVTPGANTDKVEITYTDEDDKPHTITVTKDPNGQWTATGVPDNQGITVDADTGAVKLPPDAVKDGEPVKAVAHNGDNPITTSNQVSADIDALKPPVVEQDPAHQGGIIVKPVADADKVTVKYTDEKGNDHTVTASKAGPGGGWSGDNLPEGVSVDPGTGTVTLAPKAVKDGSTVSANNSRGVETSADAKAEAAANAADSQAWLEGDASVNEGSEATYTVKLGQPADKDVTVKVKVTHVSTTDGDISYTVNTVTIAKGEQEATFKIAATDDTTPEANESYRVEIGEATGATVDSTRSSVTTEIVDNDPLNAPTVAAGDTQGSVVITPAEGADKVVVRFNDEAKQPHTATISKNPATGEWTIDSPITGVNVDPATGKITLASSAVEDGSDVTAMNSVGTRNSDPATVKAGNNPNEPEISIGGSTEVKEGETATYTVSLNKAADKEVTVTVTLAHKGTDDADFTQPPVSKTVTIPAGETSAQFTLDIAKDGKFEGSEGYTLTLSNPQGAVLGQSNVETKVTDIDPPPAPSVEPGSEQGSVVVTPANGTDKLVVNFNNEAKEPQTVTVSKDPATGEWSSKEPLPQGVTVDPKTGVVTIGATAVEDGGDVKAVASAGDTNSPEGAGKAGNNGTAPSEPTLTISGDETVEEGQAATYTIRLSEARTEETTVTVTLTHKETSDADFDASAQPLVKTLTIPAGQTEVKLTLNTADDSEAEGKETFTIGLSNPSNGVKLGDVTEVTTAINDNDSAPATAEVKSVSSPKVAEGETLVFDVAMDKPTTDTEVSLTLKGDTATLGTDTGSPIEVSTDGGTTWTPVTPDSDGKFTATVPAGSENGVKVRVPTVKDTETEADETLTLQAATKDQTTPVTGTGTITDVPPPSAEVKSVSSPKVDEGQPLEFDVAVDKPTTDTEVSLTLKGDTATLGTDTGSPIEVSTDGGTTWTPVTPDSDGKFTATVPAGSENGVKVRVPTVKDTETEADETLTLQAATKDQTTPVTGTGTITDVPPPSAEVKSVSSPKAAEGEALVFDVAVDKPAVDTEVSLTLKGDTATLGTDTGSPIEVSTDGGTTWTPVTPGSDGKFTATVPAGSENGVKVRVPTVTDTVTEQDETLTLDAAAADQTTPATGTGTITDVPPVAPQAPSVAAGTEQGSVTVTPPAGADKLTVTYKDEDKADHEVVVNKDPASGEWKGTDLPEGVTVDAKTGVVTIAAKAVLDNSEVKAVAATGTLSSDAGSGTAGEDAVNNMTGEASSEAIAHDQLGMSGEYYGYNDGTIISLVASNPRIAANVRWHKDDQTSGVNMPGKPTNNLYDLDFTERMINGRNGGKVVTGTDQPKSVAEGTPDARFTVTDINYGGAKAVSSGLANNEKTAVGQGLSQSSALRNFLDVNGAEDADSARVEAGAPYKGTSGLGYTTDAAVRIVGHVYFGEGTYDFKFALDNGATVRIDGKDIYKDYSISEADTLGKHPNGIHLTEGVHSVEIIYLEEGAVSTLHMQYKAHGAADSSYQTMGLDNNLMLKPEASLDLNQLQDVHNTGTANNPAWHVRTGATLDGGEGKDDITGSDGRDFIYGHDGNDSLTGGKGGDTFIYNTKAANGHDVIKDFKIGEDKISLTDLLDTKSIDAKAPGWKGLSEIQNAQWDDSAHKLSFDTTDGAKTYHNSITFEGMTQSYNSVDDFLRENGNGII
nr:Calx-beta domain-containing protein [uncultured Cardiobacterium sp.]